MLSRFGYSWLGRTIVLLTLCSILPGCAGGKKITKDNFDKIKNDMTLKQVEDILGEGTAEGGDGSNVAGQFGVDVTGGAPPASGVDYVWESGKKSITVSFKRGKVVNKKSSGIGTP
jgi:hypothetical protein